MYYQRDLEREGLLASNHVKDHSKKMMSTLTNAHKHSKQEKHEKEWKKCTKTT